MDKYVYMIGIDLEYWTVDDEKACKQYKVDCKGYYELGDEAGFILVGTLKNLKKLLEDYFGVAIVDEYLTEYDYFDFEDGDWIIGGWNESKKSVKKSLKESITDDDIIFKIATMMKQELLNLRLDRKFDYMFDKKTLCDMIWYICDELNADYKFHLYPKYDHGTQIRVDFIRDSVNVGWMSFEPMIKDTYPLTVEIENMLEK
jgi:hypothetical protein